MPPDRRCGTERAEERKGSIEAQDLYGTRIRISLDGLAYGEEFVPLDEVDEARPLSGNLWNLATKLFEVAVFRRHGPPLVVRNLPLPTADRASPGGYEHTTRSSRVARPPVRPTSRPL